MKPAAPLPLALLLGLLAGPAIAMPAETGPILDAGVRVRLVDVLQVPASSATTPLARINGLREAPDGSGRLFVNDLEGPMYVIDGGQVQTYLDLEAIFPSLLTTAGLAAGFTGFVFAPDFATSGIFYTAHTETPGAIPPNLEPALPTTITQHSVLTEFTASDASADVFAGSWRELMRIASPHRFHPMGQLEFDPNAGPGDPGYGWLVIGGGDHGAVENGEFEQLQRLDGVWGTVMRIDPRGGPFVRDGVAYGYGIPPSNPYASDGDPDTLGEILLHGVRNAHRLVWDTGGNGTLFFTDVGQHNVEEIDVAAPGANYGWPLREGTWALDPEGDLHEVFALPPDDASLGFTYPAAQYDHGEGSAIAGGVILRGGEIPELEGQLLFGDIVSGRLFHADVAALEAADDGDPGTTAQIFALGLLRDGAPTTLLEVVRDTLGNPNKARTDLRLHRARSGAVYLTTKQDAWIRRLLPATPEVPLLPAWGPLLAGLALAAAGAAITRRRTR